MSLRAGLPLHQQLQRSVVLSNSPGPSRPLKTKGLDRSWGRVQSLRLRGLAVPPRSGFGTLEGETAKLLAL